MPRGSQSKTQPGSFDRPRARFTTPAPVRCVKCSFRATHGTLCLAHATCEWPGCTNLKAPRARKWCVDHRALAEHERTARWNQKAMEVYRSVKGEPEAPPDDPNHSAAIALLLGRDPFR